MGIMGGMGEDSVLHMWMPLQWGWYGVTFPGSCKTEDRWVEQGVKWKRVLGKGYTFVGRSFEACLGRLGRKRRCRVVVSCGGMICYAAARLVVSEMVRLRIERPPDRLR